MGTYLIATNDGQAQKVKGTKFKVDIGGRKYNVFTHGSVGGLRLSHIESGRSMGKLSHYMCAALGDKRIAASALINAAISRVGIEEIYRELDTAPLVKDLPIQEGE